MAYADELESYLRQNSYDPGENAFPLCDSPSSTAQERYEQALAAAHTCAQKQTRKSSISLLEGACDVQPIRVRKRIRTARTTTQPRASLQSTMRNSAIPSILDNEVPLAAEMSTDQDEGLIQTVDAYLAASGTGPTNNVIPAEGSVCDSDDECSTNELLDSITHFTSGQDLNPLITRMDRIIQLLAAAPSPSLTHSLISDIPPQLSLTKSPRSHVTHSSPQVNAIASPSPPVFTAVPSPYRPPPSLVTTHRLQAARTPPPPLEPVMSLDEHQSLLLTSPPPSDPPTPPLLLTQSSTVEIPRVQCESIGVNTEEPRSIAQCQTRQLRIRKSPGLACVESELTNLRQLYASGRLPSTEYLVRCRALNDILRSLQDDLVSRPLFKGQTQTCMSHYETDLLLPKQRVPVINPCWAPSYTEAPNSSGALCPPNQSLHCAGCGAYVHVSCYYRDSQITQRSWPSTSKWLCGGCLRHILSHDCNNILSCIACGHPGGLMIDAEDSDGRNIGVCHVFCANNIPEVVITRKAARPEEIIECPVLKATGARVAVFGPSVQTQPEHCSLCTSSTCVCRMKECIHHPYLESEPVFSNEYPLGFPQHCQGTQLMENIISEYPHWGEVVNEIIGTEKSIMSLVLPGQTCYHCDHLMCSIIHGCQMALLPVGVRPGAETGRYFLCQSHSQSWQLFWERVSLLFPDGWSSFRKYLTTYTPFPHQQLMTMEQSPESSSPELPPIQRPNLIWDIEKPLELHITPAPEPGEDMNSVLRVSMQRWSGVLQLLKWTDQTPWTKPLTSFHAEGLMRNYPLMQTIPDRAGSARSEPGSVLCAMTVFELRQSELISKLMQFSSVGYGWILVDEEQINDPSLPSVTHSPSLARAELIADPVVGYISSVSTDKHQLIFVRQEVLEPLKGLPAHIFPFRGLMTTDTKGNTTTAGGIWNAVEAAIPGSQVSLFGMGPEARGRYLQALDRLNAPSPPQLLIALYLCPYQWKIMEGRIPSTRCSIPLDPRARELIRQRYGDQLIRQEYWSFTFPAVSFNTMAGRSLYGESVICLIEESLQLSDLLNRVRVRRVTNIMEASICIYDVYHIAELQSKLRDYAAATTGVALRSFPHNPSLAYPATRDALRVILSAGPIFIGLNTRKEHTIAYLESSSLDSVPLCNDVTTLLIKDTMALECRYPLCRAYGWGGASEADIKEAVDLILAGADTYSGSFPLPTNEKYTGTVFLDACCGLSLTQVSELVELISRLGWTLRLGRKWAEALDQIPLAAESIELSHALSGYHQDGKWLHPVWKFFDGYTGDKQDDLQQCITLSQFTNLYATTCSPVEGNSRHFIIPVADLQNPMFLTMTTICSFSLIHNFLSILA